MMPSSACPNVPIESCSEYYPIERSSRRVSSVSIYKVKRTNYNILLGGSHLLLPHWGRDKMVDILKRIFFNENVWISIKIWLKFVTKGPINKISALVQIMVWRRPGDKPLSEAMLISLPTHRCVTRPQWVKKNLREITTHSVCIFCLWYIFNNNPMMDGWISRVINASGKLLKGNYQKF